MFKAEVKLLHDRARMPVRGRETDACWDIHSCDDYYVHPNEIATIHTGVCISLPPGYYYTIDPRSGLLFSEDVWVGRGIIDATYTGEIRVRIHNKSGKILHIHRGDRAAQLTFHKVYEPEFVQVDRIQSGIFLGSMDRIGPRSLNRWAGMGLGNSRKRSIYGPKPACIPVSRMGRRGAK